MQVARQFSAVTQRLAVSPVIGFMRTILFLAIALLTMIAANPALASDGLSDFWVNDEQGWVVETKPCDSGLCGYLAGFRIDHPHAPDYVAVDDRNPDPARRADPLCGLQLIGGFKPSPRPDGKLVGGWVYDPDKGETYSAFITILDANTVKLRGYVAIPLFGRTITLRRETGVTTRCAVQPVSNRP
jgi:uncharacterized protein (DUF2147 family)